MNRLKEIRKYLNMTQKNLADKLNVKQNTVSYWENGRRQIDLEMAKRISEIAGCTVEYLIGGERGEKLALKVEDVDAFSEGVPVEAIYDMTDYETVLIDDKKKNHFVIRVKEDGMEPYININDIVILRGQDSASSGDIVLVKTIDGKLLIKEYLRHKEGVSFISYNRKYPPVFYSKEEMKTLPIKIIGRVMELRRKF